MSAKPAFLDINLGLANVYSLSVAVLFLLRKQKTRKKQIFILNFLSLSLSQAPFKQFVKQFLSTGFSYSLTEPRSYGLSSPLTSTERQEERLPPPPLIKRGGDSS